MSQRNRTRRRSGHHKRPASPAPSQPSRIVSAVNSFHDFVFGGGPEGYEDDDEEFTYGLLLGSLEERDANLLAQLRSTTRKKLAFKHLHSLVYEKSIIPFASDENPLGDYRSHAVAIVCADSCWGPDLQSSTAEEDNYSQIINAAQELAEWIVFIIIKHHKESDEYDGVCHPKFEKLARGPWPNASPYIMIISINEHFNATQLDVIKTCLHTQDNLQLKMEIKKHLYKARDYQEAKDTRDRMLQKFAEDKAKGIPPVWSLSNADKGMDDEKDSDKGKEKEGTVPEGYQAIRLEILRENEKQWNQVRGHLTQMQGEIDRLKKALAARDAEIEGLKKNIQEHNVLVDVKTTQSSEGEPGPEELISTAL